MKNLCVFEDHAAPRFAPLVYTRPVFDLRCGALSLREKILSAYPGVPCRLWCRDALRALVQEQNPGVPVNALQEGTTLYLNGRVLMDGALARTLTLDGPECVFFQGDTLIAARVQDARWTVLYEGLAAGATGQVPVERREVSARTVEYVWDLVRLNSEEILQDRQRMPGDGAAPSGYPGAHFLNEREISVGADTVILPGAVIDASEGPVMIGAGVRILPHTYIQGPVSIGDRCLIQAGSHLHAGVTIGPVCKVGGEIAASIFHGYSNKQHHGFLGHAYIGQWVNLGAGTTNSNLKNTYGTVAMFLNGERVDTGMTFLGLFMGDFGKTAINTAFNTGTAVGFSSHVMGAGFPPKYVPSFCWYTPEGVVPFHLPKAVEVAQRMMARRQVAMGPAETARFMEVYRETEPERSQRVKE